MKVNDLKIFIFLIPFVVVVGFLSSAGKKTPLEFEANGTVTIASWEGKNHGMPLIVIKQNNPAGSIKKFESNDILLTSEQIQVGDRFFKISGLKICKINDVEIICLK